MDEKDILAKQKEIIKKAADDAGTFSGVYKMIDNNKKVIYVGKAKNLKNRLNSYTRINQLPSRTRMMVSNIDHIDTVITNSEVEALLLECNIIKSLKPFYNILLKDDKSFPYVVISNHEFPRVQKYRTTKQPEKNSFGPYPTVKSIDDAIRIIQKTFLLRTCSDSIFASRTRPCLQYFIKRCSAPCCGKISKEEYNTQVKNAIFLLKGKNDIIKKSLIEEMKKFSENMEFEKAALTRDKIAAIADIQSIQYVSLNNAESIDIIACAKGLENSIIQMFFFRNGRNIGTEYFTITNSSESDSQGEIIQAFVLQFYSQIINPPAIITSHEVIDSEETSAALLSFHNIKSKISIAENSTLKILVKSCLNNAELRLNKKGIDIYKKQISRLETIVNKKIDRIEIYDNSHISGSYAFGCMVVFKNGKFDKNEYRKFSIDKKIANGGNDIAMMSFTLKKRFETKTIYELPDLIIIDGGKAQLSIAEKTLYEFELEDKIKVISIVKQNNRKKGDEKILFEKNNEILLDKDDELLFLLINLRDEAHRFAITTHRKKRQKSLSKSAIDNIPSIGKLRKKKLLEHFGSVNLISGASIENLKSVDGINEKTAKIIFDFFNKG